MNFDCSWFHDCDMPALELTTGYKRDPMYRSAAMPKPGEDKVPEPQCRKLTIEGAVMQQPPPPAQVSRPDPAIAPDEPLPSALLDIPDIRCPERYVQLLRCASRVFLFTRHDLGDHTRMQTLVRYTQAPSSKLSPAEQDAEILRGTLKFGGAEVGLAHKLLMSHNAAVECKHDRMLVAYGGMAHTSDQNDWQGNDVGIVRAVADATQLEPLRWSAPQLSMSGEESTGCIDENAESTLCEYDGKVSIVNFRGEVLLYTRSNLSPMGGARHVQVAKSTDGTGRWSKFTQVACACTWVLSPLCDSRLASPPAIFRATPAIFRATPSHLAVGPRAGQVKIKGYKYGAAHAANNIYFWTVRELPGVPGLLAAFYPGTLDGKGGVFMSTSSDGVHFTRALRILESPHDNSFRTRDYPVDGRLESAFTPHDGILRMTIQHRLDLRMENVDDEGCPAKPYFCTYKLSIPALINASLKANAWRPPTRPGSRVQLAKRLARRVKVAAKPPPPTLMQRVEGFLKYLFLRPPQQGVTNETLHEVRAYLAAVYPMARKSLAALSDGDVLEHFEALDYYYSCEPQALGDVRPTVRGCARLSRQVQRTIAPPLLPYLPRGAYYRIVRSTYTKPFNDASYFRHRTPLHLHEGNLTRKELRAFHSNSGAKIGPAPAWTDPLAITRYPLFPMGMSLDANNEVMGRRPVRETADGNTLFRVGNMSRVQRLLALQDGELIEVQNWGGWTASDCPPICGFWGNVWKVAPRATHRPLEPAHAPPGSGASHTWAALVRVSRAPRHLPVHLSPAVECSHSQGTGLMMRVSKPFVSLSKVTAITQMILNIGARNVSALRELVRIFKVESDVAMANTKYPEATPAECLAYSLLTLQHPCEGADPSGRMSNLVELWLRRAKRRSPTQVVREVLAIGTDVGPRYMASHRLSLHWIYSICGVGPWYARSGMGWDLMHAVFACILGHNTVVLAASPNDNGLMHQEFVDFDVPPGLGWATPANGGTNPVGRCTKPFPFAEADKRAGPRAVGYRRRELLHYWRKSEKFVQARTDTAEFVLPARTTGTAVGCMLRFGNSDDPSGDVDACQLVPQDEDTGPSAKKACYMWCEGAMSQALSSVSLFHVQPKASAYESGNGKGLEEGRHDEGGEERKREEHEDDKHEQGEEGKGKDAL